MAEVEQKRICRDCERSVPADKAYILYRRDYGYGSRLAVPLCRECYEDKVRRETRENLEKQ